MHCCASRTACFFVKQTGEIEIVWVKEKKKIEKFLIGLFQGGLVPWAICSADAQVACSKTCEARRVLAGRGHIVSKQYVALLLLSRAYC